ncbi:hypothetical protein GF327_10295, partial [Candidatus Woesearchaeota archaeon]|nr:hypothetical protein [Candidatus Woesearchaeota archaeon]
MQAPLDEKSIEKIHLASVNLLENIGMSKKSLSQDIDGMPDFKEILNDLGFKINSKGRITITQEDIEDAIKSVRDHITFCRGENTLSLGQKQDISGRPIFLNGGAPTKIRNYEEELNGDEEIIIRDFIPDDLAIYAEIAEQHDLEMILMPAEFLDPAVDYGLVCRLLEMTDRPLCIGVDAGLVYGSDFFKKIQNDKKNKSQGHENITTLINGTSGAMSLDESMMSAMHECVKQGLCVVASTASQPMVTAPG